MLLVKSNQGPAFNYFNNKGNNGKAISVYIFVLIIYNPNPKYLSSLHYNNLSLSNLHIMTACIFTQTNSITFFLSGVVAFNCVTRIEVS